MELTQQIKNYYATDRHLSKKKQPLKEEDKSEFQHFKALQTLSNGTDVNYQSTLRVVVHEGDRMPRLPPRQTQKHPGYIRNESGGFFTS